MNTVLNRLNGQLQIRIHFKHTYTDKSYSHTSLIKSVHKCEELKLNSTCSFFIYDAYFHMTLFLTDTQQNICFRCATWFQISQHSPRPQWIEINRRKITKKSHRWKASILPTYKNTFTWQLTQHSLSVSKV